MSATSSSIEERTYASGKVIRLAGVIDQTFDPQSIAGQQGVLVFDFDGVSRMTSFGVRQWMTALSVLNAEYYCYIRCHPPIVAQFNLVSGFAQRGELISFFCPYICPECGELQETLMDLRRSYQILDTMSLPPVECPRCKVVMEFDDVPEIYFQYARAAPRPRPPAAANALIEGRAAASTASGFNIRKEIEDTVTALWFSGYIDKRAYFKRVADGLQGQVLIVLSRVAGLSEEGLAGLLSFLRSLEVDSYLARVPELLVDAIVDVMTSDTPLAARVVSVALPFRCDACNIRVTANLDLPQIHAFRQNNPIRPLCPSCALPVEPEFSSDVVEKLSTVPVSTIPDAVELYLRARPDYMASRASSTETETATAPGLQRSVLGKYKVLRLLREGGMGEVFLARNVGPESFEKLVVLKRIRRDRLFSRHALEQFVAEAKIAARLSHPNIVQIFDLARDFDEYFIAMEYVNGIDLSAALRVSREARLTWPIGLCCRVISDLCAALHAAHTYVDAERGPVPIIHRDVSPGNVLLSVDGAVKLADFGIAKSADDTPKTDPNIFKGKAAYSAPEQLLPSTKPFDHRVDVYSTGVVLYECLTLQRLLPAGGQTADAESIEPWPPSLPDARPEVPAELEAIFQRAVSLRPQQRYATARELQQDLEALLKAGTYVTNEDLALWVRQLMDIQSGQDAAVDVDTAMSGGNESVIASQSVGPDSTVDD